MISYDVKIIYTVSTSKLNFFFCFVVLFIFFFFMIESTMGVVDQWTIFIPIYWMGLLRVRILMMITFDFVTHVSNGTYYSKRLQITKIHGQIYLLTRLLILGLERRFATIDYHRFKTTFFVHHVVDFFIIVMVSDGALVC